MQVKLYKSNKKIIALPDNTAYKIRKISEPNKTRIIRPEYIIKKKS